MANVTLRGNTLNTSGDLPAVGAPAPDFTLTGGDLGDVTKESFAGQKVVLNIFPSIDTPTCAQSVRSFNEKAASREGTLVLCVSEDLPFAMNRFCGAENITNIRPASDYQDRNFGHSYGTLIEELKILTRAIFVLDADGKTTYVEYVPEVTSEPNYDAALSAVKSLL